MSPAAQPDGPGAGTAMFRPFRANPGQVEATRLLAAGQLHTCLVGGARSGKTFWIVRAIVIRALRGKGSRHLIARQRYNHVVASIWLDTLPKVMALCFPGVVWVNHKSDGYVEFPNGAQIWFAGLDDKERTDKVLGLEFATIFLNECSQISYASVLTVRTRLAQVIPGLALRAYYDLNPTGTMHWSNREFGQHRDPLTGGALPNPEDFQRLFLNPEQNADNLDQATLRMYRNLPGRYRKRFYEGIYVPEVDNALWTLDGLTACRRLPSEVTRGTLGRIVVAVDPSGTKGDEDGKGGKAGRSNKVGIIVAGLGHDGCGYVLENLTCQAPPEVWGARAVAAFHNWGADRIVAEVNYGGDMVRAVIQAKNRSVPVRVVTASRGKHIRAEPVSALYEPTLDGVPLGGQPRGKVFHVPGARPDLGIGPGIMGHASVYDRPEDRAEQEAAFAILEEQMLNFSTAGYEGDKSPDEADALVWALTDLMVRKHTKAPVGSSPASIPIFAR